MSSRKQRMSYTTIVLNKEQRDVLQSVIETILDTSTTHGFEENVLDEILMKLNEFDVIQNVMEQHGKTLDLLKEHGD